MNSGHRCPKAIKEEFAIVNRFHVKTSYKMSLKKSNLLTYPTSSSSLFDETMVQ